MPILPSDDLAALAIHSTMKQFFGLIIGLIVALGATAAPAQPNPPTAETLFREGVGLIQQQQLDRAIDRFRQAIDLDPKLVPAQYNLGLALRQKGDIQGAATAFYRTIQIKPDWALAYANLGAALLEGGNLPQAQEYLERAIVLDPQSAIGHYNLGLVYQQQQQPLKARPALTTAKQLYDRQNNRTGAALAQKWLERLNPPN
jgi:tetratricopeptide (TPR) repeat protein